MCIVLVLVFCTVYTDVEKVGKFSSLIILIADALCTYVAKLYEMGECTSWMCSGCGMGGVQHAREEVGVELVFLARWLL